MRLHMLALAVLLCAANTIFALTGTGTQEDPYVISSLADFDQYASDPNYWSCYGACARLDCDIDLAGRTYNRAVIAWDTDNTNDSTFDGKTFYGIFNGNGHTVSNLTVIATEPQAHYLGLFGNIGYDSAITRLGVVNASITGASQSGWAGALGGCSYGNVTQCFSTGSVTCFRWSGGLLGQNGGITLDCYSNASVTKNPDSGYYIGGLVGINYGSIATSYSTGTVSPADSYTISGLTAYNAGGVAFSFWDTESSGMASSEAGSGRTTSEMKTASNFVSWGNEWVLNEGSDYPRLAWQLTPGQPLNNQPARTYAGSGDWNSPFMISSAADMVAMSHRPADWDKLFELANDIDMSSASGYIPPGSFSGYFDGKGHKITNFSINSTENSVGFFGNISRGTVSGLNIVNASVTGNNHVGIIAGKLGYNSSIYDCSSTGTVYGQEFVGGLLGQNYGYVRGCWSGASVSGMFTIGGLVGSGSNSTLSNCYSLGAVSCSSSGGGLVGSLDWYFTVSDCYSAASVSGYDIGAIAGRTYNSTVESCRYDSQVNPGLVDFAQSQSSTIADVAGLTTTQMQDANSFLQAGWDFVDETANGYDDYWTMPANRGYPVLAWQSDFFDPCAVTPQQTPYLQDFENGIPARSQGWEYYCPDPSGRIQIVDGMLILDSTYDYTPHFSLKEAILHLNLQGKTNVQLAFYHNEWYDGEEQVLSPFTGHGSGDGIFASNDGINWYEVIPVYDLDNFGNGRTYQVDLDTLGLSYTSDFRIKFQQYGQHEWSFQGRAFDNITVTAEQSLGQDSYEPDESWENAKIIQTDKTPQVHSINPVGDTDIVKFTINEESLISIEALSQDTYDQLSICLYDVNIEYGYWPMAYGYIGYSYSDRIDIQLPSGTYYISVRQSNNNSMIDRYSITVDAQPVPSYSGGSGTQMDPYLISTVADFKKMASTPAHCSNKFFLLTADLDFAGETFSAAIVLPNYDTNGNWPSLSYNSTFNGGGHRISNFNFINSSSLTCLGVFSYIGYGGSVTDLAIENVSIDSPSSYVGLLAGSNSGTITRCCTSGSISANYNVAGLVGYNVAVMRDCYSTAIVSSSSECTGGIAGSNSGRIYTSYFAGSLSPSGGALVGSDRGFVIRSFYKTDGVGTSLPRGGIPLSVNQMKNPASFRGWGNGSWVINPGNDFPRLGWQLYPNTTPIVDPVRIYGGGNGMTWNPYIIATAAQLCEIPLYPADWDKSFRLAADIDLKGYSYTPIADFSGTFEGAGRTISNLSIDNPTACNLGFIRYMNSLSARISDLTLDNVRVSGFDNVGALLGGLGEGPVTNCHVRGTVTGSSCVGGFIGYVSGPVTNCSAQVNVNGTYSVGGFIGQHGYMSVNSCFAMGTVNTSYSAGGFIGSNYGDVRDCYSIVDVNGGESADYLGGFCGYNAAWSPGYKLNNCFTSGIVKSRGASTSIGGFIGYCTAASISNCFWNSQLYSESGRVEPNSIGRTDIGNEPQIVNLRALTSSQLRDRSQFISAGWDFIGEENNGTADTWRMRSDMPDEPYLAWQFPQADLGGNLKVEFTDFSLLARSWMSVSGDTRFSRLADLNRPADGFVNYRDLAAFADQWLEE